MTSTPSLSILAALNFILTIILHCRIKTTREKRRAKKVYDAARFAELEKETAERTAGYQSGIQHEKVSEPKTNPFLDEPQRSEQGPRIDRGGGIDDAVSGSEEELSGPGGAKHSAPASPPTYEKHIDRGNKAVKGLKGKMFGRKGKSNGDGVVR